MNSPHKTFLGFFSFLLFYNFTKEYRIKNIKTGRSLGRNKNYYTSLIPIPTCVYISPPSIYKSYPSKP